MNHLAGLRLGKAHLAGHPVDSIRLGQLSFTKAQLAVFLS